MNDLLAARLQMAISLGFHIIFACIGMVMPFLMAYTHWRWLRSGRDVYRDVTKAWSKGVAIFFAVGAVSGTLLSFELGLLWPEFMRHAGPVFGLPFSLEGAAFFLEAIALGIYLYGWNRMHPWLHWGAGLAVGLTGLASGILVVAANGWMNSPAGFRVENGNFVDIDPIAAMLNDAWFHQALHMSIAAFVATGFAVAGIHALLLLRRPTRFHRVAFRTALAFGAVAALVQPLSGDLLAKDVARRQPIKLAAMEAHFDTAAGADLIVGGIPDEAGGRVNYAVRIPKLLSFLAYGSLDAEVRGLLDFPREEWPPILITHLAFQLMVLCGVLLATVGLVGLFVVARSRELEHNRLLLRAVALVSPLGFVAIEAGWTVTEVGRQPWIIFGVMKTADGLTPFPGIRYTLLFYCLAYAVLTLVVAWLLYRQIKAAPRAYASDRPGGEP